MVRACREDEKSKGLHTFCRAGVLSSPDSFYSRGNALARIAVTLSVRPMEDKASNDSSSPKSLCLALAIQTLQAFLAP